MVNGLRHRKSRCSSPEHEITLKFVVPFTCFLSRKSFGGILQNIKVCYSCCRLFGLQLGLWFGCVFRLVPVTGGS